MFLHSSAKIVFLTAHCYDAVAAIDPIGSTCCCTHQYAAAAAAAAAASVSADDQTW
jgi:hypothetical protein